MHELILKNFAMHIALDPDEQEQALALLQKKTFNKRSFLLKNGTGIYFLLIKDACAFFIQIKTAMNIIYAFIPKTGGLAIL